MRLLGLLLGMVVMPVMVAAAAPRMIEMQGKSPLIQIRLVFTTGAASDPAGAEGAANLTALMLGEGGTKDLPYEKIVEALYPMAARVSVSTDKEMTVFTGETHVDNLDRFYGLMRDMILHPGWRAEDFGRLRDNTVNALRVNLRGNNDEELGKEELYSLLYRGGPYAHENLGTVTALTKMSVADLQAFYKAHYTQANLMIGLAGGYPAGFGERVKKDFAALPAGASERLKAAAPEALAHNQATLVQKDTRSVAWSFGFPLDVKRGDPDYPALLVAQSWLGQHRESGGRLYNRLRELRGLNYGDYAYIEYFPNGSARFEPQPNIARGSQIFQIWLRPLEPPNAGFALRGAVYELSKLVENGLSAPDFERTRSFLSKYVDVLTKTKSAELGYAIDSEWYGIPSYNQYIKSSLAKLTLADVNRAIRKHLRADRMQIVGVASDTDSLKKELTGDAPSVIHYNSEKAADVLEEDKVIGKWPLHLRAEDVSVVPVNQVFEN